MLLLVFVTAVKAQCTFTIATASSFNCLNSAGQLTINIPLSATPPFTVISLPAGFGGTTATNVYTTSNSTVPLGVFLGFTVVSSGNCIGQTSVSWDYPLSQSDLSVPVTSVSCFGGNTGSASAVLSSTSVPFVWNWSTGASTPSIGNLIAGIYTVTVSDSKGCAITKTLAINQPPEINSMISPTFIPCFGTATNAVISTTGGVAPYSYTLNGSSVATASNILFAGLHTIVTKDNKACVKTNTILITEASQQIITPTINIPSCPGTSDGSINVNVQGSIPGYNYTWQPGNSTTANLTNIPSGSYTLSVKDASACVTTSVIAVSPASSMVPTTAIQKENCSAVDGAFTLSISGGYPPYTQVTIPGNSTSTITSGLSSGSYTSIITDAHGCIDSLDLYIGNLSTVSLTVVKTNPVECYNTCNGSVLMNVQNGILPVTYSLTGLATTSSNVVSNLCAGIYIVRAIDAIGCPAIDTVNFPTPPVFSYSALPTPIICIGKQAVLSGTASGGTGGHTYLWNPGSVYGATVSVNPVVTTVYSLNVYDSKNCTLPPYQVTVTVNPPISISINASGSAICPGTTTQITPTVSGGDGNYTYLWLPGNSIGSSIFVENISIPDYTLLVSDACGSPKVSKEITIKLHPVTKPTYLTKIDSGCVPLCTQFINTTPGSKNAFWNYGDKPFEKAGDTSTYCYEKPGTYHLKLTVTDANSCKVSFTYTNAVYVLTRPVVGFVTEPGIITLNNGENVLIRNVSSQGNFFQWYIDDVFEGTQKDLTRTFSNTGCYDIKLIAQSSDNCRDSSIRSICVFEGFTFYMPKAFTPNNDGLNDVFLPKGTGWLYDDYLFEVFNRWGYKVFSTNTVFEGWDGGIKVDAYDPDLSKTDPNDVYHWRVLVTDNLLKKHAFTGHVALIR